jgi:hypothetical protein
VAEGDRRERADPWLCVPSAPRVDLRVSHPASVGSFGARPIDAIFLGGSGWSRFDFRTVRSTDHARFCRSLCRSFVSLQCTDFVGAGPVGEWETGATHPWEIRRGGSYFGAGKLLKCPKETILKISQPPVVRELRLIGDSSFRSDHSCSKNRHLVKYHIFDSYRTNQCLILL